MNTRTASAIAIFVLTTVITALAPASAQTRTVPNSQQQILLSFAPLVKKTTPAVVNVFTSKVTRRKTVSPFGNDPFFKRFFGNERFFGKDTRRRQNSLGSGVIVEETGFIITNNHVIRNGNDFRVVLSDKREFKAKLLLQDPRTDLAILKIDPKGEKLPTLPLGDSDNVQVGDLVLAIGNPFGVGQTVTSGIVSALARNRVGVTSYQFFIQTDAAINPGNSGGALVDMQGRLVGINTAIYTRSGGSNGIGFAIPVNMVKSVIRSSKTPGGKVIRPWLGVNLQEVTQDIANTVGLNRPRGALVTRVHPQSPLAKIGIKRGDIIVRINGKELDSAREFIFKSVTMVIGEKVSIVYMRKGKEVSSSFDLIKAPETVPRNTTLIRDRGPLSGLVVSNVSPAVTQELGVTNVTGGIIVTDLKPGPAARAGFKKGDVIWELNGDRLKNVGELLRTLRQADGRWHILIRRKGRFRRVRFGRR